MLNGLCGYWSGVPYFVFSSFGEGQFQHPDCLPDSSFKQYLGMDHITQFLQAIVSMIHLATHSCEHTVDCPDSPSQWVGQLCNMKNKQDNQCIQVSPYEWRRRVNKKWGDQRSSTEMTKGSHFSPAPSPASSTPNCFACLIISGCQLTVKDREVGSI